MNRDYHEAVSFLNPEISNSIRLGNELLSRIPTYNNNEELNNPYGLSQTDLIKLAPKLNFNTPDSELKYMEKKYIKEQNYMELMELLKNQYPYDKLEPLPLYSYCRKLCNIPVKKSEYEKIRRDMKAIKKSCKNINKESFKKTNGKIKVKF